MKAGNRQESGPILVITMQSSSGGARVRQPRPQVEKLSGKKQVRHFEAVLEVGETRTRVTVETIQEGSRRITQRAQRPQERKESDELKQLRAEARTGTTEHRRAAWKRVWKMHKAERKNYNIQRTVVHKGPSEGLGRTANQPGPSSQSMASKPLGGRKLETDGRDHFRQTRRGISFVSLRPLQLDSSICAEERQCACSRSQKWTVSCLLGERRP